MCYHSQQLQQYSKLSFSRTNLTTHLNHNIKKKLPNRIQNGKPSSKTKTIQTKMH
jgi:hypothetical protein